MYTTEYVTIPLGELLTRVQSFKYEGLRFVQMAAEPPHRVWTSSTPSMTR